MLCNTVRTTKMEGKNVWCPPLPLGPAGKEDHRRHALAEQLGLLVHVHHGELEHGAGCAAPHPEKEPGPVAVLELGAAAVGPRPQPEADVRLLGSRSTCLRARRCLCIILRGIVNNQCWGSGSAGSACFLDLPEPDPGPLIRGTDSVRIRILPFSHQCVERIEIMLAK
jgi:hypothetical protein